MDGTDSTIEAGDSMRPGALYAGEWNWGAALLTPFWLMNHGRVWRGIAVLVCWPIPIVNFGVMAAQITYGIKGNEIAARHRDFVDEAQFVIVQNRWRNCGIGICIGLYVAVPVIATIVMFNVMQNMPQQPLPRAH